MSKTVFFFCVNAEKVNGLLNTNWINHCDGLVRARNLGKNIPMRILLASMMPNLTEEDKRILDAHPEYTLVQASDEIIGSVARKEGKVDFPEIKDLPGPIVCAEDLVDALKAEEGQAAAYLVGRVFLDANGYQALILSDEPSDTWREIGMPKEQGELALGDPRKLVTPNNGSNKEVKNVSPNNNMPQNLGKDSREFVDAGAQAIVSGAKTVVGIVQLSIPLIRFTAFFTGKVLKGAGEAAVWSGKKLEKARQDNQDKKQS